MASLHAIAGWSDSALSKAGSGSVRASSKGPFRRLEERDTSVKNVLTGSLGEMLCNPGMESLLGDFGVQVYEEDMKVSRIVESRVEAIGPESDEEAFFVCDLGEVARKLQEWVRLLPCIYPHYAIKCNPDAAIVRLLAACGIGFDFASKQEIETVLALGVDPSRIIFANPCKQASALRLAARRGVQKMTFDNVEELHKIQRLCPDADLIVRLAVDDSQSICQFNSKFGARMDDIDCLLDTCKELGLNLVGVSFHVGSGCGSAEPFVDAVRRSRQVFNMAAEKGFELSLLDVGGGFPGHDYGGVTFEEIADALTTSIGEHFPPSSGVRVIAEPGRYFSSQSHTLAVSVIAKRVLDEELTKLSAAGPDLCVEGNTTAVEEERDGVPAVAYYISDGVYGSFNCCVFDHAEVEPRLVQQRAADAPLVPSKFFGPTCDSIDVVLKCYDVLDLHVGEWVYFHNMGAYTRSAASGFNGFHVRAVQYVFSGVPRLD